MCVCVHVCVFECVRVCVHAFSLAHCRGSPLLTLLSRGGGWTHGSRGSDAANMGRGSTVAIRRGFCRGAGRSMVQGLSGEGKADTHGKETGGVECMVKGEEESHVREREREEMECVREREEVECVVIGAGVVGLAVARELSLAGREVVVVEAAPGIGMGVSSRSSEVIHAGIYYEPGSLKASVVPERNEEENPRNLLARVLVKRSLQGLAVKHVKAAKDVV